MIGAPVRQAVLFLSHRLSTEIVHRFAGLDIPPGFDKYILLDRSHSNTSGVGAQDGLPICLFDIVSLCSIGYQPISPGLLAPGSNHFPVIEFAFNHPEYKFVWVVEFDVVFTGEWTRLFEDIPADVDLVSAKFRRFEQDRSWPWWNIWRWPNRLTGFTANELIASFNPVYRLSHDAVSFLRLRYLEGWYGHHEVTMATLLHLEGMRIEDLGGDGEFTPAERTGKYYQIDRTYRWRPGFDELPAEPLPDCLYHPVVPRDLHIGFARLRHHERDDCDPRTTMQSQSYQITSQTAAN